MFLVKYGIFASPENLAGTSLDVAAFSDPLGNTVTREVQQGDTVLDVSVNFETGTTTGTFYDVKDGVPWVPSAINDWMESGNGLAAVSVCTDLPYQAGAITVFLPDGSFVAANLGVTLAIVEQALDNL
jgi:hypothetical protein